MHSCWERYLTCDSIISSHVRPDNVCAITYFLQTILDKCEILFLLQTASHACHFLYSSGICQAIDQCYLIQSLLPHTVTLLLPLTGTLVLIHLHHCYLTQSHYCCLIQSYQCCLMHSYECYLIEPSYSHISQRYFIQSHYF